MLQQKYSFGSGVPVCSAIKSFCYISSTCIQHFHHHSQLEALCT